MKDKTINLRLWMFSKIVPAVVLVVYYWMFTRDSFSTTYIYVQSMFAGLAGLFVYFQIFYAKRKDIFDELAKVNLGKADSICIKLMYVLLAAIILVCVFSSFSADMIGYFVVFTILLLTIVRAIVFYFIDKSGM